MKPSLCLLVCATVLVTGCESTNVMPAAAPGDTLAADETRLWTIAREEQAILDRSGFVLKDDTATSYLNGVVARLKAQPLGGGAQFTVRILIDPTLNAFAMPDGVIYVHTGLLAAAANEAQLASVLGHEITHATHRHQLKSQRDLKNKTAFAAGFSAGTLGVGGILGALGAASSLSGYAQGLEREADEVGFTLLAGAGYDVKEAPQMFRALLDEARRAKIREPFFFGSHPRLTERIASYEQLVAKYPPSATPGRVARDEYENHLIGAFIANAEAAQRSGGTDQAIASATRASTLRPDDTRVLLLLADIRRKRDADPKAALELYQRALALQPDLAEAHLGSALIAFKRNELSTAATGFTRYLELKPSATDRAFVVNLLKQCSVPR
jgi:predicted Zn-dependent protease